MADNLTYAGSMQEFTGLPVASVDECWCADCLPFEPWNRRTFVCLTKPDGSRIYLEHCRSSSLVALEG